MFHKHLNFTHLLGLGLLIASPALAQQVLPAVPREVLVKFRAPTSARVQEIERDEDIEDTREIGGAGVLRLRSRSQDTLTLIQRLRTQPDVEYAEPNYIVHAITNDTYYGLLWGLQNTGQTILGVAGVPGADINAVSAWTTSTGSRASVAAVIDTGVDYTHPDLAANVWSAPASFTVTIGGRSLNCPAGSHGFNAIAFSCDPRDDNNHGTHVSGTIGAIGNNGVGVVGVNWTAAIMGSKFLNAQGSGTTADAINAIEFAIQAKLAGVANVRVLSNSWGGGGFSQALLDEINKANSNDMLFVAAAGNSSANNDTTPNYPSNYTAPNVVAVAATDNRDNLASFSNYGATTVHLGAPGVNIASTTPNNTYSWMSGTSMATPHVSGAALLVLSACTLNTAALKTNLLNNVHPIASLAGKTTTGGRLDVGKAISACATPGTPDFSLSATPASQTVTAPNSASYTITVSPANGFTGTVSFSASTPPGGGAASFNPATVTGSGSTTMTVTTSSSGSGTITITGTSGSLTHTATVSLTVNPAPQPDFAISATPSSQSVAPGVTAGYTVTLTPSNGFTGAVTLALSGQPAGATVTFGTNPLTVSGATAVSTALSVTTTTVGTYTLTIAGSGGGRSHSTTVTLTVGTANFTLSASPTSRTVSRGSRARYTITVTPSGGFTGTVTFSVTGVPTGASSSFTPASVVTSGSTTLRVTPGSSTPLGTYTLTVTGAGGGLTRTTTVTLTVVSGG